jgi:TPR repeat protein
VQDQFEAVVYTGIESVITYSKLEAARRRARHQGPSSFSSLPATPRLPTICQHIASSREESGMRVETTARSLLLVAIFVALSAAPPAAGAADNTRTSRSEGQNGRPTTPELRQTRIQLLAKLPDSEAIVFPASGKQQAVYTIFVDPTCGACLSMFGNRRDFVAQGIRVRYVLAVDSDLARQVWCAKDRAAALEAALRLPRRGSLSHQCEESFSTNFRKNSSAFGVSHFPTIFTDDGEALVGHGPPEETLRLLGNPWDASKSPLSDEYLQELWTDISALEKAEELQAANLTDLAAAANQGHVDSQLDLAEMYYQGDGLKKDHAEALRWYRQAAQKRDALAQYWVGRLYSRGEGVEKDPRAAANWFRQSADQNLPMAQYELGVMLYNGTGVDKSQAQAASWFLKAALQGDADAQYALGLQYAHGIGVVKDERRALEWMQKAAAQGHEDARKALQPAAPSR